VTSVSSATGSRKIASELHLTLRTSTTDLTYVRKEGREQKNAGGWKRTAAPCHAVSCTTHSRQLNHVVLLRWHRPQRPPHLRGISFPSVGCVERRAWHPTRNQARKWGLSHQRSARVAHYRHPLASLARTAASRTSAATLESRIPDRDLPHCHPWVQTRLQTDHQCSAQNGAV
jgi:hypothetical protein